MTSLIQYDPWIGNTGVEPEFHEGQHFKVEYNSGGVSVCIAPKSLVWDRGTGAGNIKRYCFEIEQSPAPTINYGEWTENIGAPKSFAEGVRFEVETMDGSRHAYTAPANIAWTTTNIRNPIRKYRFELLQSPAPEIEGEWGDWEGFNGQDVMVEGDFECKIATTSGINAKAWASEYDWSKSSLIVAFQRWIEPKVSVSKFPILARFADRGELYFGTQNGRKDMFTNVEICLTTTNGERSWAIKELSS